MISLVEYYIKAAKKSQWDYQLWIRYLNKNIQRDKINLSKDDLTQLIQSGQLEIWQSTFLKLAMKPGSLPWNVVVKYSEPADTSRFTEYLKKRQLSQMTD